MGLLKKFPKEYFLKYKKTPVKLVPYSKKQRKIAELYLGKIKKLLGNMKAYLAIRGSTAYEILGKGDVEVGIYPKDSDWKEIVAILTEKFGTPENVEEDYIRFNDMCQKTEVEIIMQKGDEAKDDIALHEYLKSHPELLRGYEEVKKKYCYSKREYQIQKNNFLNKVGKMMNG